MKSDYKGYSLMLKTSSSDEYYSTQKTVDMILPYILRGGTRISGVRLIQSSPCLCRLSKHGTSTLATAT